MHLSTPSLGRIAVRCLVAVLDNLLGLDILDSRKHSNIRFEIVLSDVCPPSRFSLFVPNVVAFEVSCFRQQSCLYFLKSHSIGLNGSFSKIFSLPQENRRERMPTGQGEPPDNLRGLYQSFAAGLSFATHTTGQKVHNCHRMDLPKLAELWEQLLRLLEPHRSRFLDANKLDNDTIGAMGTWREVDCPSDAEVPVNS